MGPPGTELQIVVSYLIWLLRTKFQTVLLIAEPSPGPQVFVVVAAAVHF